MDPRNRLIVALDFDSLAKAKRFVEMTKDHLDYYKVGSALFTKTGPSIINYLKNEGRKVFLDLKFHDIPSVVSRAAEVCTLMEVDMFNLHTTGGFEMLEQVMMRTLRIAEMKQKKKPLVIGVTVLTSIDEPAFKDIYGSPAHTLPEQVILLARLAQSAGLDGVVASPREVAEIKNACGKDFLVVTPGIRLEGETVDDQARSLTPKEAVKRGADYIVVGRPIVQAKDPITVINKIVGEIAEAG
jgi:orotidine-5'-phosphate decarboxylase